MFRSAIVVAIVCFCLFLSFLLIFKLQKVNTKIINKYPTTDCTDIYKDFGSDLKKFAIQEYWANVDDPEPSFPVYLRCFCMEQKKELGGKYKSTEFYDENAKVDPDHKKPFPVCKQYASD